MNISGKLVLLKPDYDASAIKSNRHRDAMAAWLPHGYERVAQVRVCSFVLAFRYLF